ncbi:MAG TPA: peptide chain release factor 1 [Planctomycetes bacterium]|nr:peptide chain release factor 1 [Planctomycetota bacterium]
MALRDALEKLEERYRELETLIVDPEVMGDHHRYTALLKEQGGLKSRVEAYRAFLQTETELRHAREAVEDLTEPDEIALFKEEIASLETRLDQQMDDLKALFVTDDEDANRDIILEIRAGTGGDEAALFAGDLLRMYIHYAEARGWRVEILDAQSGASGGFKEVIVEIVGENVYKRLKYESGGHRVQRVPATETQGRIHTSAATVAVLPQASDVDVNITEKDLKIDTYRSSGPGGQKVNKTASAIRITHLPTGLVVTCQDEKSQHKNRARALKILASRLYEQELQRRHAERSHARKSLIGSGDRSQRIRTYNFPQNRVTDHRINLSLYSLDKIMAGELECLIEPLMEFDKEQRLASLEELEK